MSSDAPIRSFVYRFGLLICLLSGAAALSHELLWTRRLVDLLGGSSEANTRVISLFFLGLAIGAVLAHRWLPKVKRPWLAASAAEFCIVLLSFPMMGLPLLTDSIWPWLGLEHLTGLAGRAIKLVLSILVIMPPAIAMGATLPLFVTGLLVDDRRLGREGIIAYAVNTLGGLLGLLLTGTLLLPAFGWMASMQVALGANALLAFACMLNHLMARTTGSVATHGTVSSSSRSEPPVGPTTSVLPFQIILGVAFLSGFGIIACEIVSLQTVMLVVPLSFYGPLTILATVVALLALSARLSTWLIQHSKRSILWWLVRLLTLAGFVSVLSPLWYMKVVSQFSFAPEPLVLGFVMQVTILVLLTFGPMFFLLGMVFPLCLMLLEDANNTVSHHRWPILLAVNGIGGLLGAEFAYRGLMPTVGVHVSLALIGLIYLTVAGLILVRFSKEPRWLMLHGLITGAACLLIIGKVWQLPQLNPHLPFAVLSQRVGADGAVAVIEGEGPGRAILVSNQYMLGSTSALHDSRRQAHLPLLLHQHPQSVGFIGLATGITPGAALQHSMVDSILVAEISQVVVEMADEFFSETNSSVTRNPKVKVVIEDGRTVVASSPDKFDVLVGDLFLPWGSGASRLFSLQHFQAARDSLKPQGIFCQWLPMYQLTPQQFYSICRTFQQAFPTVYLFRNNANSMTSCLALVGFRDGQLSWETVQSRCGQVRQEGLIEDPAMHHWQAIAMHFLGTLQPMDAPVPTITLNNMWLEIDASRHQVTGRPFEKYLFSQAWVHFVRQDLPKMVQSPTDGEIRNWQRLGVALIEWQWQRMVADTTQNQWNDGQLKQRLLSQFPSDLIELVKANPVAWPGDPTFFK